jgi:hypothetical protein
LPALTLYRTIAELDQKYYPERLGKLFVVNSPFMFVKIWALAKRWLDPGMLRKVHICDKDFQVLNLKKQNIFILAFINFSFNLECIT